MKLHFEPNLDYQLQAIEAVCTLFKGQELCRTEFTVTKSATSAEFLPGLASDLGIGNRLTLLDDELLKNLHAVQLCNGLPPSETVTPDFTVEMETGTGKTYVYLRTAFELNKLFGFTKFVIVVPSVAIKEGVNKTLEMTRDHFESLYPTAKGYEYFQYDSAKLGQVRNFATSPNIQLMVITVHAINKFGDESAAAVEESDEAKRREKSKNVMYRSSEKTGGEKPIDLIRSTRPIIIVDEPQSVDGGIDGRGRKALDRMHPLCTLRYSATHVDKHNMVYRLDAVDAYERRLVKQIEVAAATIEDAYNRPYVRLLSVSNKRGLPVAKVEIDVQTRTGIKRQEMILQDGDNLELTTGRAVYRDCRIGEIRAGKDGFMELRVPGGEHFLKIGQAYADTDAGAVQRQMIRRTIKEHLDKELRLRPKGIKVLSLFFIDSVEKYRQYDADGNPVKGEYAEIFEAEYRSFMSHPDYRTLFSEVDFSNPPDAVHNGYFSIDRKKIGSKTVEVLKDTSGATSSDNDTYNLIMREKEKLLQFSTPLKFIFSHSALREGWDNPNIFQICTLREIQTERERRQTIGRGLRLCVNQDGDRQRGFEINTLTVIANESYQQFAENLQSEIETDTGYRFGIVEKHQFAGIPVKDASGANAPLGFDLSATLWNHLLENQYINAKGKIQSTLKIALADGTLVLPPDFEAQRDAVTHILRKLSGRLEIKNADERRPVLTRQAVLDSPEFKALWDRIKHQTTYRVQFDNAKLITSCIDALQKAPPIAKTRLQWRKADIAIGKSGVEATERAASAPVALEETPVELPDLLTELQDRTQLTRRTIKTLLTESRRLDDFKRNPQQFIDITAEAVNRCKRLALVDGIKYQRLGAESYYAQELFVQSELSGYIRNMMESGKSVYEKVVYDSDTERNFASELEKNESIKIYAKLPGWFKVPTPLGTYNPDWAVLVQKEDGVRLYFVVETKPGLFDDDLRDRELAKIKCGKAHFKALTVNETSAQYIVANNIDDLMTHCS
ncbi:MAG: DEAD/DEAH box helicase family protein [Kiritimatiellae bacterium]|nr:DEAD/DEAH box helicase family protein [Kiritimatiellia bacterium]